MRAEIIQEKLNGLRTEYREILNAATSYTNATLPTEAALLEPLSQLEKALNSGLSDEECLPAYQAALKDLKEGVLAAINAVDDAYAQQVKTAHDEHDVLIAQHKDPLYDDATPLLSPTDRATQSFLNEFLHEVEEAIHEAELPLSPPPSPVSEDDARSPAGLTGSMQSTPSSLASLLSPSRFPQSTFSSSVPPSPITQFPPTPEKEEEKEPVFFKVPQ